MIGWIVKMIPAPYRLGAAIAAAGVVVLGSGIAGWKARDYFADRKELKEAKMEISRLGELARSWELASKGWEAAVSAQNERAAEFAKARDESQAKADKLAQDVQSYRVRLTRLENANENGTCERTDPCHWLLFNAAVTGTDAPSQCTAPGSVQD